MTAAKKKPVPAAVGIPPMCLMSHIAIIGKSGSGKTYTAKGAAEKLLDTGQRFCVIDPTGAWWGLRSSADGKTSGYPVVVFGGDHADVPLDHTAGAALAAVIAKDNIPAVIDVSCMTVGQRTRFFTDFAETILRENRAPLHLFMDEAHCFAPQGRVSDPQSGKMLHAANNLVSMGRSRGLRIVLISQRPAKLHKDSLTQVETLIAMRLIAPQDRAAVNDWIGEWAGKGQGKELMDSLPSLPNGEGWIWSPEIDVLERKKFPIITTFDSSKTPTGIGGKAPVLAHIDLGAIEALLGKTAADMKENDPAHLRSEIASLKHQLTLKDVEQSKQMANHAYETGKSEGRAEGYNEGADKACEQIIDLVSQMRKQFADNPMMSLSLGPVTKVAPLKHDTVKKPDFAPKGSPALNAALDTISNLVTTPQQKILDAAALLESLGVPNAPKNHIAAFSGASPKSSAFMNNLGRLRTNGLIDYPRSGEVCLTDKGRSVANAPESPGTVKDLHRAWMAQLSGPQGRILQALIGAYPNSMLKENLANASGASVTSSAFMNNLGSMRSLGIIDYPQKGEVIATPMMFLEA